MSTTFDPYAFVVIVALINTNKEIIMFNTPLDRIIHITHMARKKSCWCFKAFHILQLFVLWLNLDCWFCIGDVLYFQKMLDGFISHEVVLRVHLEKFGSAVVVVTFFFILFRHQ